LGLSPAVPFTLIYYANSCCSWFFNAGYFFHRGDMVAGCEEREDL
jgi:hypothetical protein